MRYSKEREREYISYIRRILVRKPDASVRQIREILAEKTPPLKLDKDYILKLVNKIRKERANRINYYTINNVLAFYQDEIEELKKRLWNIIADRTSSNMEKISAIRELRTSSKDLFDKMFDAGIFEKKLGELKVDSKLTKEEQDLLKNAIEMDYGKTRTDTEKDSSK